MKRSFLGVSLILLLLLAFLAPQVYAYTVYDDGSVDPWDNFEVPVTEFTGVGKLVGNIPGIGMNLTNTATLLIGREYILTAAHSVTGEGNPLPPAGSSYEIFFDSGESYTATNYWLPAGWAGVKGSGLDIAVLQLDEVAVGTLMQYDIYTATDEVGQVGEKVGYGRSGDGNIPGNAAEPSGTKRAGENLYDAVADVFLDVFVPGVVAVADAQLGYDFDDGTAAHDGFGFWSNPAPPSGFPLFPDGLADTGLGAGREVMSAPGDSGGPTFIDDKIAGITSVGARLEDLGGNSPDIDGVANSTYGEFGVDTRVSFYAGWINDILDGIIAPTGPNGGNGQVPEPSTLLLTVTGLLGLAAFRRKFRK